MRPIIDRFSTNILRFLPAFLVFVIPLFFLTITPDFFTFNKQYLVFAIASIALIFFCFRLVTRGQFQLSLSPSLLPLALFALVFLASTLFKHPIPRIALLNSVPFVISLFFIFLTTTSTQKNDRAIKSIIIAAISSATLLSLFSLLKHFGVIDALPLPLWAKAKYFNPAGSPYHFLTFAVPVIVSTIGYGVISRNWLIKPLVLASAIIIAAGSIFSLKLLLTTPDQQGLALLPYSSGWSIAVDTLKTPKTAFLGTGPDTFNLVFTKLRPTELNRNSRLWNLRFQNSSSEFLTLLTVSGVLGLIFFSLSYLRSLKALLSTRYFSDPETSFLALGITSVLLSFTLLPGSIPLSILGVSLLIAATIKLKLENHKSTRAIQINLSAKNLSPQASYQDITEKNTLPQLPLIPWLLTLISFILIGIFWNFSSKVYTANLAIFEAAQNIKDNPLKAFNKQVEAVKIDPANPYLHLNLSQTYFSVANSYLSQKDITDENKKRALEFANQAVNEAKTAANLNSQDVTVWENFAIISRRLTEYNVQGAPDWTLATYGQAIALDPTNPSLRVQLGTFYFLLGDLDQAIRILNQAIDLKPDWNVPYYNLSLIYKTKKDYPRALAFAKEAQKYTQAGSDDAKQIDSEIKTLEDLAPKIPTPSPTPNSGVSN